MTKEEIFINEERTTATATTIKKYIDDLNALNTEDEKKKFHDNYGFNAQYCNSIKFDDYLHQGHQGCYVSLYMAQYKQWYYFCGDIDMKGYEKYEESII